jgi:hypothetical protein
MTTHTTPTDFFDPDVWNVEYRTEHFLVQTPQTAMDNLNALARQGWRVVTGNPEKQIYLLCRVTQKL